jgi:hypothetical protein
VHEPDRDAARVGSGGGRASDRDQAATPREALRDGPAEPRQPLRLEGEESRVRPRPSLDEIRQSTERRYLIQSALPRLDLRV